MTRPHVVILGAGFAGVGAVRKLADAEAEVTLIDANNYHTFQPLLYQVATAELDEHEVGFPVRGMLRKQTNLTFMRERVTGIDLAAQTVGLEAADPIPFDYLMIGLGAEVNYFGTPGAAEYSFPLYTMRDALRIKRHLLERLEAVDKDPSLADDGALTFGIVGGGATGVEIAGALAELLEEQLDTDFRNLPIEKARVILFEMGEHLLAPFKAKLRDYAKSALEERKVDVRLGEGVKSVTATDVTLQSGETIRMATLIWAAGVAARPFVRSLGIEPGPGGRIPVLPDLSIPGHPKVYAVGDIAAIASDESEHPLPQLGSVALQSGDHAGHNISRQLKGDQTKPFKYHDKGTMATIGRFAAVVERKHVTLTGRSAWLAWLGVHLVLLSGGEERAATIVDWGWNRATHSHNKLISVDE